MKVVCSFYIGYKGYLLDDPSLPENKTHAELTSEVSEIVYRNIAQEEFKISASSNLAELNAVLNFEDESISAVGFSTETAIADDEDGQPVLFYVNAHFEVPEEFDPDEDVDACLNVGSHSLIFDGFAEVYEGN